MGDRRMADEIGIDILDTIKSLVQLLENGDDGWNARDYRIHQENVLANANEIIRLSEETHTWK